MYDQYLITAFFSKKEEAVHDNRSHNRLEIFGLQRSVLH